MPSYLLVTTTVASEVDAKRLAKVLVEKRLAACVQITGPITSVYRWQAQIEDATEWVCSIKTKASAFQELSQAIAEVHSYDVPEIVATPIRDVAASYAAWLDEEVN